MLSHQVSHGEYTWRVLIGPEWVRQVENGRGSCVGVNTRQPKSLGVNMRQPTRLALNE